MIPIILTVTLTGEAPVLGDDRARLDAAMTTAEPSPESATELAAAIHALEAHPRSIAHDAETLALLTRARLALVWVYLLQGEASAAEDAMDEAIRAAMGDELPAQTFGPDVVALYGLRLAALEAIGTATVRAECNDCALVINEHLSSNPSPPVYLGTYRVWLAVEGGPPRSFTLTLSDPDAIETVFPLVPPPRTSTGPATSPPQPEPSRLLPRWASLIGIGASVGLVALGGALTTAHLECYGETPTGDEGPCRRVYSTHPQDYMLIAVGALSFATFGATLSYDEVRVGRARGRQAMVTWSMQF